MGRPHVGTWLTRPGPARAARRAVFDRRPAPRPSGGLRARSPSAARPQPLGGAREALLLGDRHGMVELAELHGVHAGTARAMEPSSRAAAASASSADVYAAKAPGRSSRRAARYSAQRERTSASALCHASSGSTWRSYRSVGKLVRKMAATVRPNGRTSHHRHDGRAGSRPLPLTVRMRSGRRRELSPRRWEGRCPSVPSQPRPARRLRTPADTRRRGRPASPRRCSAR